MNTLLVTGASGFVGKALTARLVQEGQKALRLAARTAMQPMPGVEQLNVGDIGPETDWLHALEGVSAVVHLAARVHVMAETCSDPWSAYYSVNVEGTRRLAEQAAACGVKRFVFVSSIKVNGESTALGKPYTAADPPAPEDAYGRSKYEAEKVLTEIGLATGMEVVVVRPPLVYGPGVKANFLALMQWLDRGVPLPLGSLNNNRRSFVALDNLVDLIMVCLKHPAAANQIFLAADGEDLSTAELLRRMARALDKPSRLWPVPPVLLKTLASLAGKRPAYQRLSGSLQVDITKNDRLLAWHPVLSVDQGLKQVALWNKK